MSKRYLGIIFLLYTIVIGYVVFFNKLKTFLAPSMQIYIILSLIPMLIIGIVMVLNDTNYKFKISDLVFVLPIILLVFTGDGKLTSAFANNRTMRVNIENNRKNNDIVKTKKTKTKENSKKKNDTISKFDFDVVDATYSGLANYISYVPKADRFKDKTIRVRGFALKNASYLPDEYFAIGKYAISCCAADAEFNGFFVQYDVSKITDGDWYEIEGILDKGKDRDGYDIMYIKVTNIKQISSEGEEQYIYSCYAYGDGSCEAMSKYDLEY